MFLVCYANFDKVELQFMVVGHTKNVCTDALGALSAYHLKKGDGKIGKLFYKPSVATGRIPDNKLLYYTFTFRRSAPGILFANHLSASKNEN